MENQQLLELLLSLTQLPRETEWAEFKVGDYDPDEIGEYLSALANSAALHQKDCAYIVWGVEDITHKIVGTPFRPRECKVGNEELENWLTRLLALALTSKSVSSTMKNITLFYLESSPADILRFVLGKLNLFGLERIKRSSRSIPKKSVHCGCTSQRFRLKRNSWQRGLLPMKFWIGSTTLRCLS